MEIESMVANTALIRAREGYGGKGKGRSRRWRELLRFPHINQCTELEKSMEREYYSLCVDQPIGKALFHLYCDTRPELKRCVSFLEAMSYGCVCSSCPVCVQSPHFVQEIQESQQQLYIQNLQRNLTLYFTDYRAVHDFLSGAPFKDYQKSMYFDRFLQWKTIERKPVTRDMFREYRILGKGGFGEVSACQSRASGKMYACKKLEKKRVKKRKGEALALNEKQILEKVNSRFVVSLAYAYETKDALCLVLTLMNGGDLKFHIYNMGSQGFIKSRVQFYSAEILCGLDHLHQNCIAYRDLKPENILLDDNGHIRLSDLGLAVDLQEGQLVRGKVGTAGYMAPEVIKNEYYSYSPDWWGLGCIIYEMTSGNPPFRDRTERVHRKELELRVLEMEVRFNEKFDKNTKSICQALFTKNPKERLGCKLDGAAAVRAHPFFKDINFRRLEAGMVAPSFVPDKIIYCIVNVLIKKRSNKVLLLIYSFQYKLFSFLMQMIESECFKELNVFGPRGSRTPDLDRTIQIRQSPELRPKSQQPPESRHRFINKLFKRQVSYVLIITLPTHQSRPSRLIDSDYSSL
uniref:G protein-coupled receptor kinase n=1 Tax=Astyanax mexicanus TaxID=7994 RepID=W5LJA9_ASTMX